MHLPTAVRGTTSERIRKLAQRVTTAERKLDAIRGFCQGAMPHHESPILHKIVEMTK